MKWNINETIHKQKKEKIKRINMKSLNGFDFLEKLEPNCPKCGGAGVSIEFIPEDVVVARVRQKVQYLEALSGSGVEHLLCKCKTCGYMYLTYCKDNML